MSDTEFVRNMSGVWDGLKNGRNAEAARKRMLQALRNYERVQAELDPRDVEQGDTPRL